MSAVSTKRAPRVVIVDEDQARGGNVALLLAGCGINVECVTTPKDADTAVARYCPDMIMLRLEPYPDGEDSTTHLERGGSSNRPFSTSEFVARLRVERDKMRHVSDPQRFESGGVSIDFQRLRVRAGEPDRTQLPEGVYLLQCLVSYPD